MANDNGTNAYEPAFRDVMEFGITMIVASDSINAKLKEEGGLPSMHYKISRKDIDAILYIAHFESRRCIIEQLSGFG